MGRLYKPRHNTNHEFELDLAPLLAVMVKLVPVLLISSAFVQIMVIETELPQAVKEAIQEQEKKPTTTVQLAIDNKKGVNVVTLKDGKQSVQTVPLKDGKFDLTMLHLTLQKVKLENPEIFKIEFAPEDNVPYSEIVKMMDECRRSKDPKVKFPVFDKASNKEIQTEYMFPDVVFSNMMDG